MVSCYSLFLFPMLRFVDSVTLRTSQKHYMYLCRKKADDQNAIPGYCSIAIPGYTGIPGYTVGYNLGIYNFDQNLMSTHLLQML